MIRIINWFKRQSIKAEIEGIFDTDKTTEEWLAIRDRWIAAGGTPEDWDNTYEQVVLP